MAGPEENGVAIEQPPEIVITFTGRIVRLGVQAIHGTSPSNGGSMKTLFLVLDFAAAAAIANSAPMGAQISNDIVKIGVLSDMSSLYSDATGPGSVIAAQMAAADFNGKVK